MKNALAPLDLAPKWREHGGTLLLIVAVLLASLSLHIQLFPVEPPDMEVWLLPWYRHVIAQGPIGAFSSPFSNYTPPYLYLLAATSLFDGWLPPSTLIKLLSVAGSAFLAVAVHRLLRALDAPRPVSGAFAVLLLPSVIVNAGLLGQCDAMWTGACVWGVAEAIRGRTRAMLVWVGIALAFKAQTAFLAPFVLAVLLARRAPLVWWLLPPAAFLALMAPALAAGWPLLDILLVYPRQAQWSLEAGNAANLWTPIGRALGPDAPAWFPLGYVLALLGAGWFVWRGRRARWTKHETLAAAALCALILPWLLPKMHERYFLLADILAFALAAATLRRGAVLAAVAIQAASLLALVGYWFGTYVPAMAGSILAGLALLVLLRAAFSGGERPEPVRSIAPLPLGVDGVEGEGGFTRARQPGDHRQGLARDRNVDGLEIMLARAADGNVGQHRADARW